MNKNKPVIDRPFLAAAEEKVLLTLSRYVLEEHIIRAENYFPDHLIQEKFLISAALKTEQGVFVTLLSAGHLRGCIGYITGRGPLFSSVIENTMNAASRDPRFSPVREQELAAIKIDISVMTPLQKISSLESITVGRDGLYLKAGIYCGVFLPQVPLEQGWNKNQYLEHLSLKAGLDQSGYLQSDAEIFSFQAQVFGE